MSEIVAERDAGRGGFDKFAGARAIEHARLSGHVGLSFYTGGGKRKVQSRKQKIKKKKHATPATAGPRTREIESGGGEFWVEEQNT
jgi:hypothetical protein